MIKQFKNWFNRIPSKWVGVIIILGLTFILTPLSLIVDDKQELSLDDEKTLHDIQNMIFAEHGNCQISHLALLERTVYPEFDDSIMSICSYIESSTDIDYYTNIIEYTIEQNDVKTTWITIFEVKYSLWRENVGQHLVTRQLIRAPY